MEQTSLESMGKVCLEGFLVKKGHVRHAWKTRWFKLSETSLRYYKDIMQATPQGRISLHNAKLDKTNALSEEEKGSRENVFKVTTEDGLEYPIQASTTSEYTIWTNAIQSVIDGLNVNMRSQDAASNVVDIQKQVKSTRVRQSDDLVHSEGLPSDLPKGKVVKRDIFFKRGHIVSSWKARCFVLQQSPPSLSYFDPKKKTPKTLNTLSLNGATAFEVTKTAAEAALSISNPPDHLFCVKVSSGEIYLMIATSDEEKDDWIESIKSLCKDKAIL